MKDLINPIHCDNLQTEAEVTDKFVIPKQHNGLNECLSSFSKKQFEKMSKDECNAQRTCMKDLNEMNKFDENNIKESFNNDNDLKWKTKEINDNSSRRPEDDPEKTADTKSNGNEWSSEISNESENFLEEKCNDHNKNLLDNTENNTEENTINKNNQLFNTYNEHEKLEKSDEDQNKYLVHNTKNNKEINELNKTEQISSICNESEKLVEEKVNNHDENLAGNFENNKESAILNENNEVFGICSDPEKLLEQKCADDNKDFIDGTLNNEEAAISNKNKNVQLFSICDDAENLKEKFDNQGKYLTEVTESSKKYILNENGQSSSTVTESGKLLRNEFSDDKCLPNDIENNKEENILINDKMDQLADSYNKSEKLLDEKCDNQSEQIEINLLNEDETESLSDSSNVNRTKELCNDHYKADETENVTKGANVLNKNGNHQWKNTCEESRKSSEDKYNEKNKQLTETITKEVVDVLNENENDHLSDTCNDPKKKSQDKYKDPDDKHAYDNKKNKEKSTKLTDNENERPSIKADWVLKFTIQSNHSVNSVENCKEKKKLEKDEQLSNISNQSKSEKEGMKNSVHSKLIPSKSTDELIERIVIPKIVLNRYIDHSENYKECDVSDNKNKRSLDISSHHLEDENNSTCSNLQKGYTVSKADDLTDLLIPKIVLNRYVEEDRVSCTNSNFSTEEEHERNSKQSLKRKPEEQRSYHKNKLSKKRKRK